MRLRHRVPKLWLHNSAPAESAPNHVSPHFKEDQGLLNT